MKANRLILLFLCLLIKTSAYGQLSYPNYYSRSPWNITSPIEGAVYQRDLNKQAVIKIKGSFWGGQSFYTSSVISAELKKLDLNGNEVSDSPISIPITVLGQNNDSKSFSGQLSVPGGWYKLTITSFGTLTGTVSSKTMRIGVGEVFIIAGQSNAQGINNNVANNPAPTLDAVRVQPDRFEEAEYLTATDAASVAKAQNFDVKKSVVSPLVSGRDAYNNSNSGISPLGNSLWYWVAFGEKIAQQYQVPVAFFNAAWGGTTIKQWQESTNPNARPLGGPDAVKLARKDKTIDSLYRPGAPYGIFKNALKFYGSTYGVRSVLWLQGETDAKSLRGGEDWKRQRVDNANDYAEKLTEVISKSRQDLAKDLPWMVGKTSFFEGVWFDAGTPDAQSAITIRQGQEQVITSGLEQLKRGPDIDQIKERAIGPGEPTHLTGVGLAKAADAWFSALTSSDLLLANPVRPARIGTEPISIELYTNGNIITPVPSGARYVWYSGNGGKINLNTPVGYGSTMPNGITDPLVLLEDSNGNFTLCGPVLTGQAPPTNPNPPSGSNNGIGLLGSYYNNTSLSDNPVRQQVDPVVNFTWGDQGPSPASGVNATNMSVRWSGQVEAPVSGTYKFKTLNDDATRLTVNGQQLISDWPGGHAPVWLEGTIDLTAGQKYPISLDFNQGGGGAQAQLYWEYPGQGSQIIPQSRLYPDGANTPTNPTTPTNPNPPSGGSLAFQIVSYDCNSGVLQYKFSSSDGSPVSVTLPGIFGGTMNPNTVATHTFPSDAKVGRNVTGTASQSGNQININFTNGCNMTTDPNPPANPNPPTNPTGGCSYSEGQYLLTTSWGEVIYAHLYNGVLYAAYQDGNSFKPKHWLEAVNFTEASCFAENDPRSSGGRLGVSQSAVSELSEDALKITIYPNPNDGHFEISTSVAQGQIYTLQITDLLGHILVKREVVSKGISNTEQIDLPDFSITSVIVQAKKGLKVARELVIIHK
jgi:hypothetical protein